MPIVLFRVDERLIHGQVVVGWGERLRAERIVVVDDELAASPWEQELYALGVPAGVEATFTTVAEARRDLAGWRVDHERTIVLVRDVATLARLAERGALEGTEVNLGGVHHAVDRVRLLRYLFLSPAEQAQLRAIAATGAVVSARDLPDTAPVTLDDLLERAER
jgi:PTS system mannose-specific IIB component/fructoselysine and glucoselysine-specific PTS system IIB component